MRRRPSGFTQVELLVAVICICLLAGIIYPTLQDALGKSRLAICLDRLRVIGHASATYSTDDPTSAAIPVHPKQYSQNAYNPSFIGAYEWGGKSGVGRNSYVSQYSGTPLGSKYGTAAGFGPAYRPLNAILYPHGFRDNNNPVFDPQGALLDTQANLTAFRCPADQFPPSAAHCLDWTISSQSSFDHFGTSFAANTFMVGSGFQSEMRSNSPYLRPLTRVPNPARTLSYEENIGRWAWACRRELDECVNVVGRGVNPDYNKSLLGWHGKDWTYNRAFVDAHAETQTIYREGTEDAEGYAHHYYNELVFPDNEDAQATYRCVIVRGDGWQKDTLPDEPIPTGLIAGASRPSYEGCVSGG